MSRIEKLLEKFKKRPTSSDIKFKEADKLLRAYGFVQRQPSGGSSHFIYSHPELDNFHLPLPRHGKAIKKVYVRKVVDAIEMVVKEVYGGE